MLEAEHGRVQRLAAEAGERLARAAPSSRPPWS